MTQFNNQEYLTPEEAASILGVSRRTVDRYARQGLLKRHRPGLRTNVLYLKTQVEQLVEKRNRIEPD
jgi:excisionase family DNA binding protein